jgi:hypothetical protein
MGLELRRTLVHSEHYSAKRVHSKTQSFKDAKLSGFAPLRLCEKLLHIVQKDERIATQQTMP